jgi:hypothetical protein
MANALPGPCQRMVRAPCGLRPSTVIFICAYRQPDMQLMSGQRAETVQQVPAEVDEHRSAGPVDLLIAASAERERLTFLCDDHDYKVVASVTG